MKKDVLIYEVTHASSKEALNWWVRSLRKLANLHEIAGYTGPCIYQSNNDSKDTCKLTLADVPFIPDNAVKALYKLNGKDVYHIAKGLDDSIIPELTPYVCHLVITGESEQLDEAINHFMDTCVGDGILEMNRAYGGEETICIQDGETITFYRDPNLYTKNCVDGGMIADVPLYFRITYKDAE